MDDRFGSVRNHLNSYTYGLVFLAEIQAIWPTFRIASIGFLID